MTSDIRGRGCSSESNRKTNMELLYEKFVGIKPTNKDLEKLKRTNDMPMNYKSTNKIVNAFNEKNNIILNNFMRKDNKKNKENESDKPTIPKKDSFIAFFNNNNNNY